MNIRLLIEDYKNLHRLEINKEIQWFQSQQTLEKAIEIAAISQNHKGKR